jgi:hypothetical protein
MFIKEKLEKHRINMIARLDGVEKSYIINQLFAKNGNPFNLRYYIKRKSSSIAKNHFKLKKIFNIRRMSSLG